MGENSKDATADKTLRCSKVRQVLPYGNLNWEKLSIFLNFLVNKLPAPEDQDLSRGILEAVDMDTYRTQRKAAMSISLETRTETPILPKPSFF